MNFLNHANFALPNQSRGVANFGRISALAKAIRPASSNSVCTTNSKASDMRRTMNSFIRRRSCAVTGLRADTANDVEFFEKKVRPVLVNRCYACHSAATKPAGGLRVDDRNGLLTRRRLGPGSHSGRAREKSASLPNRAWRSKEAHAEGGRSRHQARTGGSYGMD